MALCEKIKYTWTSQTTFSKEKSTDIGELDSRISEQFLKAEKIKPVRCAGVWTISSPLTRSFLFAVTESDCKITEKFIHFPKKSEQFFTDP